MQPIADTPSEQTSERVRFSTTCACKACSRRLTFTDLLADGRVLVAELEDAKGQLVLVNVEAARLVQRHDDADEEHAMLALEREGEAIDDGAHDLEQLREAVVVLGLVDERVEHVVDALPDEGAQRQELAVQTMQHRLQEIALTRVLAIKQVQQLHARIGFQVFVRSM